MCKIKIRVASARLSLSVGFAILAAGFAASLSPVAEAQCQNGADTSMQVDPLFAHINDIVKVKVVKFSITTSECPVQNLMSWLTLPDGSAAVEIFDSGLSGVVNATECVSSGTDGDATCAKNGYAIVPIGNALYSYKIKETDLNNSLSFTDPTDPANKCSAGPSATKIYFLASHKAMSITDVGLSELFKCDSAPVTIVRPGIAITKECDYPPDVSCFLGPIKIKGTVSNTGDVRLNIKTLIDDKIGPLQLKDAAGNVITSLAPKGQPGDTGFFSGEYTPKDCIDAANTTDKVKVTAEDTVGPPGNPNAQVEAEAQIKCSCVNPCLTVEKTCIDAPTCTDPIVITAVVDNCGDVEMVNVTAKDTIGGVDTPLKLYKDAACSILWNTTTPLTITLPALSKAYVCTTTTAPAGSTVSDTVSVRGEVVCLNNKEYTASSTKVCNVPPCPASIVVIKEVACVNSDGTCPDFPKSVADLSDAKDPTNPDKLVVKTHNAEGIKVETLDANGNAVTICPKFCYRLTVINNGEQDVTVTSITDDNPPGLDSCTPTSIPGVGGKLLKGQRYSCTIKGVELCADTANTFTVNGTGDVDGTQVTSADTDYAKILTAKIRCDKFICTAFDGDGNTSCEDDHITFVESGQNQVVHYYVKVTNDGDVPLSEITAADPVLFAKGCKESVELKTDTGEWITLEKKGDFYTQLYCDVDATLCADLPPSNTITVSAIPKPGDSSDCLAYENSKVVPAKSKCTASVDCQKAQQCRVTGGGVLLPGEPNDQDSCSPITTTVLGPLCNALEAVKITHGGQLGAPYAQTNCGPVTAETAMNGVECIRGQWEHVRHYRGKANPRSYVEVDNFHSNTPKGIFDSLMCACLPCCENPTAGGFDGKLCNPDDHKICGPEPRPAPANAIVFTGVGYLRTCDNGNGKGSSEAVLFRVYIEDRSEPGGAHPGGAKSPADVYSFQAWKITGQYYSDANILLRSKLAAASCAYISGGGFQELGLPNPKDIPGNFINDSGGMHTGNHQIHPSTSATCP